jgi:hypothetical protein
LDLIWDSGLFNHDVRGRGVLVGCKVRVRESVGLRVRVRVSIKDSGSRMHVSFFMVEGEG